jgi:xyloglucan-specific exo-beta-1,4-glucanase
MPKLHLIACLLAVLAGFPMPAAAASSYVWRNVRIGGGGYMPNIVFSPAEKGLAYLRSDMGGAYRWDAQAGAWVPLQDGDASWNARGVESVVPDPKDPNTVYAAVGVSAQMPGEILISHDRGSHWQRVAVPFRMAANDLGRDIGERLGVDPSNGSLLYFASRQDGLQKSTDGGRHWTKVESFPYGGTGPTNTWPAPAGLSFVLFDPTSAKNGVSQTIYVGNADPQAPHLYVSRDGGHSWQAVAGGPDLRPIQGALDRDDRLFIAFADGPGPYMVKTGAVYVLDTKTGRWSDISPDPTHPAFAGLSLDAEVPGTLVVASLYRPVGDTIWRSTDAGAHWTSLKEISTRDVSATPFLKWGRPESEFGWWMTGLAIDPFDSTHIAYTTGATVYASKDLGKTAMLWKPWTEGVEQTAVIALASPPAGPALFSAIGDIGSYTHFDLNVSPPLNENPIFTNGDTVDYAEAAPNVVVRSGTHHAHPVSGVRTASLAYSEDSGKTWQPLFAPLPAGYRLPDPIGYNYGDAYIDARIVVSADGKTFIVMTPDAPSQTADRGQTWVKVKGVPAGASIVADRAWPRVFYAVDYVHRQLFASNDAGRSFAPIKSDGLPADISGDDPAHRRDIHSPAREIAVPLMATPGIKGDLWFVSGGRTFHSTDAGKHFAAVEGGIAVTQMAFGKAPPNSRYPALFAIGRQGDLVAIWRSDDAGQSWMRINDADHEYFRALRCIAADARVFGRVYVGTDGRGIVYGEPK